MVTHISLGLIGRGGARVVGRDLVQIGPYTYRVVGWSDEQSLILTALEGPDGFDPDRTPHADG